MTRRIAIIDLGTNTFHLLIVDIEGGKYHLVYRERNAVKLGMAGINVGTITADAEERALSTIRGFKQTIDSMAIDEIKAYGTSALRNATNASQIIQHIKHETGIVVEVISGAQEAEFIHMGVRSAVALGRDKSLIIDIGGGSVEFVIGNEDEIFWKDSVEIGAQRLLEEYQKHDPITSLEIRALHKHFEANLNSLFEALGKYKPKTLVGSSGTFDTLSDIYCIKHGVHKDQSSAEAPLTFTGFREIFEELLVKDRNARMIINGMIEMRVDMIVVASCLIDYIIKRYDFEQVRVSNYALKEGVLSQLLLEAGN